MRLEQLLAEQERLLQAVMTKQENTDGVLRFGQTCVSASCIAQQYFCEKKVEMQYLHGKVETEAKQLGTEGHETLLIDTVKVKRAELLEQILSGRLTIAHEILLLSRYNDLILVGRPDAIVFVEATPLFLFEYKFSRSQIPFTSYHVQAKVYGKILEGVGFDTSRLHYVIAVIPPARRDNHELFKNVLKAVVKSGPKEAEITIGEAKVYVNPYRSVDAQGDIDWTMDFWRGTREAIPTRNPSKCRSCEYRDRCEVAQTLITDKERHSRLVQ